MFMFSSSSASSDEEPLYPSHTEQRVVASSSRADKAPYLDDRGQSRASSGCERSEATSEDDDEEERSPRRVRRARTALGSGLKCVFTIISRLDQDREKLSDSESDGVRSRACTCKCWRKCLDQRGIEEPWRSLASSLGDLRSCLEDERVLMSPTATRCLGKP